MTIPENPACGIWNARLAVCAARSHARSYPKRERLSALRPSSLESYLGKKKFRYDVVEGESEIGVTTGMAWTQVGGDTLFIETAVVPGTGKIQLTGQLGDVMQESAKAAITYIRSIAGEYGIDKEFYKKNDLHVHVPEGAVPKDGPSAGVTMFTSVMSALTGNPIRKDVAMTGEITLRGKVLPVGGIKEKVLAAHRAGIRTILLPRRKRSGHRRYPAERTQTAHLPSAGPGKGGTGLGDG